MNSDPHESAAWRTFGMLDSDESASYDEAMRQNPEMKREFHEMERLAAAIAVASTTPVTPRAGQLERLHLRLGLDPLKRPNWLGISGWAAALAMGLFLIFKQAPDKSDTVSVTQPGVEPIVLVDDAAAIPSQEENPIEIYQKQPAEVGDTEPAAIVERVIEALPYVKLETKRLIQEIEVLREKLETFQNQDRMRFEPTEGMAWPIVVRMLPPGSSVPADDVTDSLTLNPDEPTITAMLGDALASANSAFSGATTESAAVYDIAIPKVDPSAIPIYDSARDSGTLVVSNLPPKTVNESYNLWVTTEDGLSPVHVGRLPENNKPGAESFDFNLGSTKIVPKGFLLTRDKQGKPQIPSERNTVLVGPR